MNTKRYGNIGEAKTLSKFVELGIPVYVPFGDNEKTDLVIGIGNKLIKLQIKTCIAHTNGCSNFNVAAINYIKGKTNRHKYTKEEIDYFVLYDLEFDKLYMLEVPAIPINTISLRHFKSKNPYVTNIKYASDYEIDKVLPFLLNN